MPLYEEALELDPKHEDCLYYLGQCRRELGEPVAAREAFDRLVELNPDSARGHLALGALLASPDPAEPLDLETAEVAPAGGPTRSTPRRRVRCCASGRSPS